MQPSRCTLSFPNHAEPRIVPVHASGSCRHVNIADMTTNARSETGSESHTGYATGLFRSCLHAFTLNGRRILGCEPSVSTAFRW